MVHDEIFFLIFVEALCRDREMHVSEQSKTQIDDCGLVPVGWENHTIESFLEAAGSRVHATDFGSTQGLADASPLKKMAVLYCGKIYE